MSLNGLDVNAVIEAHQFALADPGGWFLLKYANRDTVEVLSRGNGGAAECKGAVEQYGEKSPLYGMLQYRRKRVLLKYIPDGTSRLLQVRTSVQFQSIIDVFPHDTVFSFTAAIEFTESALGLCTMLQPASVGPLQSSNSSLRQRRLDETSEDVEEPHPPVRKDKITYARPEPDIENTKSDRSDTTTLPPSAIRAKALLAKRKEESRAASQAGSILPSQPDILPTPFIAELPADSIVSEPPMPFSSFEQPRFGDVAGSSSSAYRSNAQDVDLPLTQFHHSRHLSENESKNISQWNEQVAEYVLPAPKPKKKLAPRPHVEAMVRPKTATQYEESSSTRPVANLPTSIRVSNRANSHISARPGSQQSTRSVPARFLPSANVPPLPDFNLLQPLYMRPESRKAGSVVSSVVTDTSTASPEKLRLMKALQNRRRNQVLGQRAASAQSNFVTNQDDFPMGGSAIKKPEAGCVLGATIQEETAQPIQAVKGANDSSTASPTSVGTISDNPSTRPSSLAEDPHGRLSQESASNDTDSSSTPKALAESLKTPNKKHSNGYDSAPDINEDGGEEGHSTVTPKQSVDENQSVEVGNVRPQVDRARSKEGTNSKVEDIANRSSSIDTRIRPYSHATTDISEDEGSLVDELRTATVHHATSVSVSRPPLTPTMRTYSHDRSRATTRSTSSLTQSGRSTPKAHEKSPGNSIHSLATALPQWPAGNEEDRGVVPLTKKAILGHSISQRIKALEDSSRKDISGFPLPPTHEPTSNRSTLTNMMKRNSFVSQIHALNGPADKRHTAETSKQTLPFRFPQDKPQSSRKPQEDTRPSTTHEDAQPTTPTILNHVQGRQYPAVNQSPTWPSPSSTLPEPAPSGTDRKRFSFTSYRSGTSHRSGATAKYMQPEPMASRTSLSKESKISKTTASEASSINDDRRGSRATRLMKRISGFGTRSKTKGQQRLASRDDLRPDPIIEQREHSARSDSIADSTMQMIDIGDVNVQFPESLLWKRRYLRIDDQGYLIFAAPTEGIHGRPNNRKFHLGDIQEPCMPDSEREEMAWSVLLDLRDGNCVQCACESKQGQTKVLKMLLDAHSAYHSLYPDALE